ncbi:MAG TPA: hypothetical protein VH234_00520 [Candidatus Saccharimonadales bacterium]|jgi:hypothetical protein|nr:hypothetical protein [Candidatus Saccharimonadales bacterium]
MAELSEFSLESRLDSSIQEILEELHGLGSSLMERCVEEPPVYEMEPRSMVGAFGPAGGLEIVRTTSTQDDNKEVSATLLRARFGKFVIPLLDVIGASRDEVDAPIAVTGYWGVGEGYSLGQKASGNLVAAVAQGSGVSKTKPLGELLLYFADQNVGDINIVYDKQLDIISGVIVASGNLVNRIKAGQPVDAALIDAGRFEPIHTHIPLRY